MYSVLYFTHHLFLTFLKIHCQHLLIRRKKSFYCLNIEEMKQILRKSIKSKNLSIHVVLYFAHLLILTFDQSHCQHDPHATFEFITHIMTLTWFIAIYSN